MRNQWIRLGLMHRHITRCNQTRSPKYVQDPSLHASWQQLQDFQSLFRWLRELVRWLRRLHHQRHLATLRRRESDLPDALKRTNDECLPDVTERVLDSLLNVASMTPLNYLR